MTHGGGSGAAKGDSFEGSVRRGREILAAKIFRMRKILRVSGKVLRMRNILPRLWLAQRLTPAQ